MLIEVLTDLFVRDLNRVMAEIQAFSDEDKLWYIEGDVKNSAGNLALHLVGNLNHYVGATLGDTGYARERDREFSDKDVPSAVMVKQLEDTVVMIREVLGGFNPDDLTKTYPLRVFDNKEMTTMFFMVHLTTHLNYHLGQINYLRRLCD